mgnify:FL=1|tara:strand:+ start:1005 stop:2183 length:1179 start_codon:yes stop_codon:yes gene_type:complete
MKKICVVELKSGNHSVAELCKYANPEINEVLLFTTSFLLSNIKNDLGQDLKFIKIVVKDDNKSFYSFVQLINRTCYQNVDLLILNTVSRWEFLFLKPNCPTAAYFYSLNFWFRDLKSSIGIFKNFFQFNYLNFLSWFPNRWHANPYFGYIIRKKILKKIDGIIVEYPPFVDLLKDNYNVSKPVYFLPKRSYNNTTTTKLINKTVFVIPGMISQVRREYDLVLDAFQNIPKEIQSSVKLIILGRPIKKYGLKIIERLKKLDKSAIEIEYFTKFISHEKFSQSLLQADVIIAPIKLDYYSGIINEKFTYTKGTGTFHDMLRYSKLTLVPSVYNISKEFEDCFIKYRDSSELSSLIVELSTNENQISKQKELTSETIKKYSLINVQLMFEKLYEI